MVTLLLEVKTPNHKVIRRLTIACEVLKRKLSAENTVESKIELDTFLPDGGDLILSMSKAKLEHLCEPLFKETMEHVKSAKLAKIHFNKEIDEDNDDSVTEVVMEDAEEGEKSGKVTEVEPSKSEPNYRRGLRQTKTQGEAGGKMFSGGKSLQLGRLGGPVGAPWLGAARGS